MTVEERLERLERENRRLRFGAVALLALIGFVFTVGQVSPVAATPANLDAEVVRAQKFVLVNQDGKNLGVFGSGAEGLAEIYMYDRNDDLGVYLATIGIEAGGGALLALGRTAGPDSRARLLIRAYDDNKRPFINAFNEFKQVSWGMP